MHARRTLRRAAATAGLVAAAAMLVAASGQGTGQAAEDHAHHHAMTASANGAKARALHDGMRRLWEDHITWTRLAIVSFAADLPDFPATADRLLRNQDDIGDAIKPYYGAAAGRQLTGLLRDHITGAVDLLAAAKAGDAGKLTTARTAWYANADAIAGFLSKANPRAWPARAMRSMMRGHLDDTLAEAVAQLEGDYPAGIRAYDRVHRHILMMADALSAGIVHQFPRRFR